jgi:NADP-dependent aldehyde dehydrogenase
MNYRLFFLTLAPWRLGVHPSYNAAMQLHGRHFIGNELSSEGSDSFRGVNPATRAELDPPYHEATGAEIDRAVGLASEAFEDFRSRPPEQRARLLDAIATEIEKLGDALVERANAETALGVPRLTGERARTANQLRMFARMVEEGSWVQARIDHALPDRKPLPRPDLRRMLIPIGPIVSFAASNFPLAISVAGNDTASGLAAGCPIVIKAHPAHPGTTELVASAVVKAVRDTGMPEGTFSVLHGRGHEVGLALVRHPLVKAVAFTGSLRAGRALFDAANARPEPIPVFAEMGSINPVFVLPGALEQRGRQIAEGLKNSVTLGVGQFCTNPGLVVGVEGEATRAFVGSVAELISATEPATMLYDGIRRAYADGVKSFGAVPGVKVAGRAKNEADAAKTQAAPTVFTADAVTFLGNRRLGEELFGPATLVVTGKSKADLERIAGSLEGHLTATVHGTPQDLEEYRDLIAILETKVGRLVFNGFPTGIEPCNAVHHGGPYPATTDARTTSIGTAAVERFVRPLCYQDFPQAALPAELRDDNPRKVWRLVDGQMTRD